MAWMDATMIPDLRLVRSALRKGADDGPASDQEVCPAR
jgi:hypothetical protein